MQCHSALRQASWACPQPGPPHTCTTPPCHTTLSQTQVLLNVLDHTAAHFTAGAPQAHPIAVVHAPVGAGKSLDITAQAALARAVLPNARPKRVCVLAPDTAIRAQVRLAKLLCPMRVVLAAHSMPPPPLTRSWLRTCLGQLPGWRSWGPHRFVWW